MGYRPIRRAIASIAALPYLIHPPHCVATHAFWIGTIASSSTASGPSHQVVKGKSPIGLFSMIR
jgi:hypothetical protein